jgi:hypothetical protein
MVAWRSDILDNANMMANGHISRFKMSLLPRPVLSGVRGTPWTTARQAPWQLDGRLRG